jgi:shikimate kinase
MSVFRTLSVTGSRCWWLDLYLDRLLRSFAAQPFEEKQRRDKQNQHSEHHSPASSTKHFAHISSLSGGSVKHFPTPTSRYIGRIAMTSRTGNASVTHGGIDRSVVLVGMMGVGKSTIGRLLADRLGVTFVDSDDEIEKAAGMPISEMFERYGEASFRDGERRVIARLVDEGPKVIATGGGAFVNEQTRALIKEQCRSVWIDADLDVLVERVSRRSHRPLLIDRDPREVLTDLAEKRNPIYGQADIHVRSDAGPHTRTVNSILEALA